MQSITEIKGTIGTTKTSIVAIKPKVRPGPRFLCRRRPCPTDQAQSSQDEHRPPLDCVYCLCSRRHTHGGVKVVSHIPSRVALAAFSSSTQSRLNCRIGEVPTTASAYTSSGRWRGCRSLGTPWDSIAHPWTAPNRPNTGCVLPQSTRSRGLGDSNEGWRLFVFLPFS